MANVFQPVSQQPGPQVGQVSAPIASPSDPARRDRSNELLSIMDGASRIVSAFGQQRAAQQGAEAQAGQDRFLADFEQGFAELEEQRALLQGAEQEVSASVFQAVRDGAAPEELGQFVEALDDIRAADESGVLDPYRYRAMVERATANAMGQNPAIREDIVKIRDRYIGRESPAQQATNTAQMLQNEYMTANYGSSWDEHDLFIEAKRVVKAEQIGDLSQRLELAETKGRVAATEIDFAVRESTEASITALNNRFSSMYNSQGFLNEDQILEYEDSLQRIGTEQRSVADSLVQTASRNGMRVTDDRIDRIRGSVDNVIEGLSISNLEGRDLGNRLDNIRKLEENWLEHNVPMLPFVEMFSAVGGDQTISRLAHLERLSRNPAGIERFEGLVDPATMELTNSIHGAFWQTAHALENREQFRDTLSTQQRSLYDFMMLDVARDNPVPEGKEQDFSNAVEDAVLDIDVATGEVGQAMDYLTNPNVVGEMAKNPTSARITLSNIGRQLFDMAVTSTNDPEVMRDVDISNIRTTMGMKPARDIENFISMIDQYADVIPELGGGREFFDVMVDHNLEVRRQQREAREARVSPRQQAFRSVEELAEVGGLSEQERSAMFMLADGRGQRSIGSQVAALEKLGVPDASSMLREEREAALTRLLQEPTEGVAEAPAQEQESDIPLDDSFVQQQEGTELEAYIPSQGGQAIANSGVTVATGFDVGQHSVADMRALGLDEELVQKLAPYTEATGTEAQQLLEENPVTLTTQEQRQIDAAVNETEVSFLRENVEGFDAMPDEARQVLMSLVRNFGRAGMPPKTTRMIEEGDFAGAIAELRDESAWRNPELQARRNREADLLERLL